MDTRYITDGTEMRKTPVIHKVKAHLRETEDGAVPIKAHIRGHRQRLPKKPQTTTYLDPVPQSLTGKDAVLTLKEKLEKAGLGRLSTFGGGEIRGWTRAMGSTGFSVAPARSWKNGVSTDIPDEVDWHIVVSGKNAGLRYREYEEWHGERQGVMRMHDPIDPNSINPRIKKVFESLGMEVKEVKNTGHQLHWDDDVDYNIITKRPKWLLDPTPDEQKRMRYGG